MSACCWATQRADVAQVRLRSAPARAGRRRRRRSRGKTFRRRGTRAVRGRASRRRRRCRRRTLEAAPRDARPVDQLQDARRREPPRPCGNLARRRIRSHEHERGGRPSRTASCHFPADGGAQHAAIGTEQFEAVPLRRVVAGGDLDAAGRFKGADGQADGRRGGDGQIVDLAAGSGQSGEDGVAQHGAAGPAVAADDDAAAVDDISRTPTRRPGRRAA